MSTTLEMPSVKVSEPCRRHAVDAGRILLVANCVAILALAIWMRCWKLGNVPGINGDEAWCGVQALRALRGESFAWRTPTGNPTNPFFFGPLVFLHALFPPSFVLLRTVAVASGVAALLLNFFLCRRLYGPRAATASTMLLAVLPINIAYSRFAWDASQSLAATTLVMYLPLLALHDPVRRLRWMSLSLVAYVAAILVHPTNVFAAPLIGVPIFYAYRAEIRRFWSGVGSRFRRPIGLGLVLAAGGAAWLMSPWLETSWGRLSHPSSAASFLLNYGRLFSGATIYRFISGSVPGNVVVSLDLAALCMIAAGLYGFYQLLRCEGLLADRSLAWGSALSCLAFFLIAGPGALAPHVERYAMCLIAPAALILARGGGWLALRAAGCRRTVEFGYVALAWGLLAGFYVNYFWIFERTGGMSHRTFQTAAREPKLQAFEHVLSHCDPSRPVHIVTEEWWNYWPIAYLALREPGLRVSTSQEQPGAPAAAAPSDDENAWFIEFFGSTFDWQLRRRYERYPLLQQPSLILDYSGSPVISIYGPTGRPYFNPKAADSAALGN